MSVRIHQASGMVAAQGDCSIGEAFVCMTARATEEGRTLELFARDVIAGIARFDD